MASVTVRCFFWQPQQYQKLARAVNDLPTHMLRRNYVLRTRRQISGSHCGSKSCVCHRLTICLSNFQHAFLCLVEITFVTFEISGSHSGRRVWKKMCYEISSFWWGLARQFCAYTVRISWHVFFYACPFYHLITWVDHKYPCQGLTHVFYSVWGTRSPI